MEGGVVHPEGQTFDEFQQFIDEKQRELDQILVIKPNISHESESKYSDSPLMNFSGRLAEYEAMEMEEGIPGLKRLFLTKNRDVLVLLTLFLLAVAILVGYSIYYSLSNK